MTDQKTASRDRVEYAQVLVDVALNNCLLDEVTFEDQHGCDFILPTEYGGKPIRSSICNMFGHEDSSCWKMKTTAVWIRTDPQIKMMQNPY